MVALALLVLGTVAGSFFCALAEAALLSSSMARVRVAAAAGRRGAKRLLRQKERPGPTLASVVFLNNLINIAGAAIVTAHATEVLGNAWPLLVAVLTALVILFGEILPKVLGEAQAEPIAMALAPTVDTIRRIVFPLVYVAEHLLHWARPRKRISPGDEREIRELARLGQAGGHLEPHEAELISRVFRLDDISAADVMTPRGIVRSFRASDSLEAAKEQLLAANHSQFPVYEEDLDKVVGSLTLRDALAALARGEGARTIRDVMKPAWFLPTSRKVDDVLRDFQAGHRRMAVVIDEYGVTQGIITMDDLVEELVGEAIDETDVREGIVKRLSRTSALVHGLTRIWDVSRFLNCTVRFASIDEETATVTGALQERLGRIPHAGDTILLPPDLLLEVKEADGRKAVRVLAKKAT
jgi:CBS domain containing-hemolysin-like protein